MKKKKKKPNDKLLEIEKEIEEMLDPDSIEQFTKEDKEIITRYIG